MVTLEEIYQKYFGCDVPFGKTGRLTKSGSIAHEKLLSLIKDLESLGVYADGRLTICQLDEKSLSAISYKQEMCNDLMRFVTYEIEDYVLKVPVSIDWGKKTYNIKYFALDIDYNDIFMTEEKWYPDSDIDIICFTQLKEEDAKKVFEAILSQEIENGWDWRENAMNAIHRRFPEINLDLVCDFINHNWQNLGTDAWNVENFANTL